MKKIIVIHYSTVWLQQTKTWLYSQITNLPTNSIQSHVVCEKTQNLKQFKLHNIHSLIDDSKIRYYWDLGLRKIGFRPYLGYLVLIAKRHKAQIIHSHFGDIGWRNLDAIKHLNVKHVVTFYGLDVNQLPSEDSRWKIRYKRLFKEADLFLCEGPHMGKCLVNLGCKKNKIKIHHLGVSLEKIPYHPRSWKLGKPLKVLIAASFKEKKGIPYALEALATINKRIKISISIIGDASPNHASQREKKRIFEVINDNDMSPYIEFLGFCSHSELIHQAYKHHLFISPSVTATNGDTEGGAPVSIIEMIASGIPVVSTQHCDIPNVVDYNIDDWLVSERDSGAITDRINYLIDNPSLWRKMLDMGRKHVEREFDLRKQGKKLGDIYQNIVMTKVPP